MRWLQGWIGDPPSPGMGLLRRDTSLRARRLSSRPDELGWFSFERKKLGIIQDLWEITVIFWGIYGLLERWRQHMQKRFHDAAKQWISLLGLPWFTKEKQYRELQWFELLKSHVPSFNLP